MQATQFSRPDDHGASADVRAAAIATLVAAFEADAAMRMFYPGDLDYHRHAPGFLTAFGGRAFEAGVVDLDPAGRGAALWFPPGVEPDGEAIMAHLQATVPPDRLGPLAAGMEIQGRMQPPTPHWYLPLIGVRPRAQGAGVGSALLARGLARADAEGLPAYLEATSERNAMLYLRHGFEVHSIATTPGYPEIIAMWRPARTPGRPRPLDQQPTRPATARPGLFARIRLGLAARRRRRLTLRALSELDDHLLDDIGLGHMARRHTRPSRIN